ncbi:MAG TPA: kelch repeat-containing protein, partial [Thermoanaerobaculia bacterium]|nr:kelch repeat-containing protein [Thermoanaerobaculia bacterium]
MSRSRGLFPLLAVLLASVSAGAPPNAWTPTAMIGAPEGRAQHVAVWTGDRMIVWGGYRADGIFLGDGAIYDPATKAWTRISPFGAPS